MINLKTCEFMTHLLVLEPCSWISPVVLVWIRLLCTVRISHKNHPISSVSTSSWMDCNTPSIISLKAIPFYVIVILKRWTISYLIHLSSWTFQSGVTKWRPCQKPVSVFLQECLKHQKIKKIRWRFMNYLFSISFTPWSQMAKQLLFCLQVLSLPNQELIRKSANTWWTIKCWQVSFPCRPISFCDDRYQSFHTLYR